MLADLIYFIHLMIFIPIILSFFYKNDSWLKYNLLMIPLILMDWYDYDDQCSLTSLEARMRGTWKKGSAENEDAPAFFQPVLNKLLKPFNKKINRKTASKINIWLFLLAFLISFYKFSRYKKISLFPKTKIEKIYFIFLLCFLTLYIINFILSFNI